MKNRIRISKMLVFSLIISLLAISGCSIVDQKIRLNYTPLNRTYGLQKDTVVITRTDAVPFVRNNMGEWIVGSLNNVYGIHKADLVSDRNIGDWITDALIQELTKSGYKASYKSELPPGTVYQIAISDINSFMNVNKDVGRVKVVHELKFNINLFHNGQKVKTFAVASRNNQTLVLDASEEENEKIMLQSLQDAMQQVLPEIVALTGKK